MICVKLAKDIINVLRLLVPFCISFFDWRHFVFYTILQGSNAFIDCKGYCPCNQNSGRFPSIHHRYLLDISLNLIILFLI
jgi:hypothetical protein